MDGFGRNAAIIHGGNGQILAACHAIATGPHLAMGRAPITVHLDTALLKRNGNAARKRLRQEAEDATDRYFDAAWAGLGEAETKELKSLLERMAEALQPPEEEA